MTATIVFDFDGTLALGEGPVLAYAHALEAFARDGFMDRIRDVLAAFEAGDSTHLDGYQAVAGVARADGIDERLLSAAYESSRRELGTAAAPVSAPEGLADLLRDLAPTAALVLATNAPALGVHEMLAQWGVASLFTQTHFSVGKPEGLTDIIAPACAQGCVLSVGDIADFDLAPAAALGADTALVGATALTSPFAATMRGRTLTDLSSHIRAWAASAAAGNSFPHTHPH